MSLVGYNNQRVIFLKYMIFSAIFSYLLGSINPSIIISKYRYGKDIRNEGSGNAGATNTLRTFGKKTAVLVFVTDFMKGLIAVAAAKMIISHSDAPYFCMLISGFFVQAGHCFPIFFRFKGGKGVATAAGAAMGIMPSVAVILLFIFAVVVALSKIVSLASGICAVIYPLLAYFLTNTNSKFNFLFATACSLMIIILHSSNFARLIDGTEKPVSTK